MAAMIADRSRSDSGNTDDRLALHNVEVVPSFVRESGRGRDRADDAAVVITAEVREDERGGVRTGGRQHSDDGHKYEGDEAHQFQRHIFLRVLEAAERASPLARIRP